MLWNEQRVLPLSMTALTLSEMQEHMGVFKAIRPAE